MRAWCVGRSCDGFVVSPHETPAIQKAPLCSCRGAFLFLDLGGEQLGSLHRPMQVRVTRVRFPPPPLLLEKLFHVVRQGERGNVES